MTHYSVQPRDRIFVKSYGFLSFLRYMGKSTSKNLSKYRNFLIMLNNLLQMQLKLFQKKKFKKTAETIGDLIGHKITSVSKT